MQGIEFSGKSIIEMWKFYDNDMTNESVIYDEWKDTLILPDTEGNLSLMKVGAGKLLKFIKLKEFAVDMKDEDSDLTNDAIF